MAGSCSEIYFMKLLSLVILIVCSSKLSGQTNNIVFYARDNYSKTDFSKIDSLSSWFYVLTVNEPSNEEGIHPLGQLMFQRTTTVHDSITEKVYGGGFLPNISFQVYKIKDSAYCFEKSLLIKKAASCVAPDVGGDIIIFGNFIFLNLSICLQCKRFDNAIDYCRPVINQLFLSVDKRRAISLEQIVRQFPIEGQIMKLPF